LRRAARRPEFERDTFCKKKGMNMADEKENVNPFLGIAGAIGGFSVAIVVLIGVFAREHMGVAPWIIGALAVMGICLGYFASKRDS
jgi:hypothetical protein